MRTSKNNHDGMPAFFTVDELKLSANTNKIIAELNDFHDQLLKKINFWFSYLKMF